MDFRHQQKYISILRKTITKKERRNILVRVIVPTGSESLDRIIKATNSQTKIPDASLRATEKIHRDIGDYFKTEYLFYERRKNSYKNGNKPHDKIINIPHLAPSVMSIYSLAAKQCAGKAFFTFKER